MATRIVKQTLANGDIQYAVQSNRLLDLIPVKWYTVYDGIFKTYEEAYRYAGSYYACQKVVKEEEVIKSE